MWERFPCDCRTELVWDGARLASAGADGDVLRVGVGEGFLPEQLLATAADASLMLSFLTLAKNRGLEVLGYVSSARVACRSDGTLDVALSPCLLVGGDGGGSLAVRVFGDAVAASPVCAALRPALHVEPEIVEVAPVGGIQAGP